MGYHSYTAADYTTLTSTATAARKATSHKEVFRASKMHDSLNPAMLRGPRESRNSPANPKSTPVILALDVTGSMGSVAHSIVKEALPTLITEIYSRKPVTDPHISFMAVGDVICDEAPLQVSQFESDATQIEELKKIWMEGRGGGNSFESYNLPWHFAAFNTACDAFKDGRKGFLFTFGDEEVPAALTERNLKKVYGDYGQQTVATNRQLLELLEPNWEVYHLIIEQGSHMAYHRDRTLASWNELLGQRAILVSDYTKMGEIIISIMQISAGDDVDAVAASWSGETAVVVANATRHLATCASGGIVRIPD